VSLRVGQGAGATGRRGARGDRPRVEDSLGWSGVKRVSFTVRRGEIVGVGASRQRPVGRCSRRCGHPTGEVGEGPIKGPHPRRRGGALTETPATASGSPTCLRTASDGAHHAVHWRARAPSSGTTTRPPTRRDPAPPALRSSRASIDRSPSTTFGPATARSPRRRSRAATSRRSCWPASSTGPELLLIGQPPAASTSARSSHLSSLVALRDAGKALLLSRQLDEILALADRILVMHDGRIVGDVPRPAATERTLGLMMAGGDRTHNIRRMPCSSPVGFVARVASRERSRTPPSPLHRRPLPRPLPPRRMVKDVLPARG